MTAGAFPFLFHGPSPDDWFDEPVHAWLLRFARAPSPSERASLAAAWERAAREHTRGLGADTRLPWLWSGEWAVVQVRPGDRSRDTMRALFSAMQSMLRAAHAATPLAEVIYAQAADVSTGSAWEAWTVEQSPLPTEAPPWPAEVVTHAKKSRKRSKAATDASFEAAREQLRADVTAPKVASVTVDEEEDEGGPRSAAKKSAPDDEESVDDDGGDDSEESDDEGSGDEGGDASVTLPEPRGFPLRLVEVDGAETTSRFDATYEEYNDRYSSTEQLRDGTWAVLPNKSKKEKTVSVALLCDGETVTTALDGERLYHVRAWSPTRREMLVIDPDYRSIRAVPVDGAEGRVVWNDVARDSVNFALWLADDTLFISHPRGASIYPAPHADQSVGAHFAWSSDHLALTTDRRGVVSCSPEEATVVTVVAPVGGALRVAGEASVKTDGWCSLSILADGIYLYDNDRAYRIEGASEAIDALLASPGDTARFPELPRVASPEERNDPTKNTDSDDCYNRGVNAKDEADDANAERWYRRTVELAPKNASAWHGLGHVLQRLKRDNDATPCLERALAEYDAQLVALTEEDDPDEREELRFWRAAALCRLRRRDEALAELRAIIPDGHRGNHLRRRVADEEDFESLKSDPDFTALTAKVAKPKRAPKAPKKAAKGSNTDDGDDDEDE